MAAALSGFRFRETTFTDALVAREATPKHSSLPSVRRQTTIPHKSIPAPRSVLLVRTNCTLQTSGLDGIRRMAHRHPHLRTEQGGEGGEEFGGRLTPLTTCAELCMFALAMRNLVPGFRPAAPSLQTVVTAGLFQRPLRSDHSSGANLRRYVSVAGID